MSTPEERQGWREVASRGLGVKPTTVLALLDELEAVERERDEARISERLWTQGWRRERDEAVASTRDLYERSCLRLATAEAKAIGRAEAAEAKLAKVRTWADAMEREAPLPGVGGFMAIQVRQLLSGALSDPTPGMDPTPTGEGAGAQEGGSGARVGIAGASEQGEEA